MPEIETQRPDFLKLWDFDDPAGSEARFRALLVDVDPVTATSDRAQLLSQIARSLGLQRRWSEAHAVLDEAEGLLAGRALPVARLRCRLERGRTFDSPAHRTAEKQREAARSCYLEVFETGRELGLHGLALDAAHMLGIIEPAEEALAWNLRSIALAEASEDEQARAWLGALYNNTGWAYHDRGEFARARDYFEKALAWYRVAQREQPLRIARWCLARCLRSLGQVDEALAMQTALWREAEAAGAEASAGYTAEELGECLLALGRDEEARPWFALAHATLSQREAWLIEAEPERMARLARLGAG